MRNARAIRFGVVRRSALVAAALLAAPAAWADPSNYRPYLVGARAGGMGGAFTALADDPAGPFYNPAGIALVSHSQFSLSGSLFGVVRGSIHDALGDGHNFVYANLQTFPIQTSVIYKLGPDPATSPDAIGFSIFVPNSTRIDDRDDIGPSSTFFLEEEDSQVWVGPTYARRFGPISVGISVFGILDTSVQHLDLTAVAAADSFANIAARIDETTVGLIAGLGVRWDVSHDLKLGLSVYTPELGVFSKRKNYVRVSATTPEQSGIATAEADDLHATPILPLRVQAGVAWTTGDVTLAADVIFLAPRQVYDDGDRADQGFDRYLKRQAVVNASVGVEVLVTPSFPFRAGFWTDFSAAPEPTGADDEPINDSRLHRFGGSLGFGLRGEHTESNVSVQVAYSSGKSIIPDNLDFTVLKPTDQNEIGVYLVFATSFQF